MTSRFKGEPSFTCHRCSSAMCEDCKSMAEEYEYLANQRGHTLARQADEIAEKDRTIARLQAELNSWKEMATIGFPDLMKAWMDAEVQKAVKAGRRSMRAELKRKGLLPEQIEKRVRNI